MLWSRSARPLRAELPRWSMSSDEGVECGSASVSVRRCRSRRGTLPGTRAGLAALRVAGFAALVAVFLTVFFAGFCATLLAAGLFLADAFCFEVRLAVGRLAE